MDEVNRLKLTMHIARRLLLSLRGLLALVFFLWLVLGVAFLYNDIIKSGTISGELINVFATNPQYKAQWFFFDNLLSKIVTVFIAPMFIFDAVSGDRSNERMGIMLSRPFRRRDYLLTKLSGASLAFGVIFFSVMAIGFPLLLQKVPELTAGSYFATVVLMYLLGLFSMCVTLFLSTLSRNDLISFIATFGTMILLLIPNANKYTTSAFMNAARFTPHYYATYFTTHSLDPLLYVGCILVISAFSIPFVMLSVLKFEGEDL